MHTTSSARSLTRERAMWLAAAAGAYALTASSCDQPRPFCIVTPAPFAVKLIEQDRQGDCADFGPESFNADPEVGLAPYYARDAKGQPDYRMGSVAIQTLELGSLSRTAKGFDVTNSASDASLYSMGDFASSEPDDNEICSVPDLSTTHLKLDALPPVEDDPATEDDDESFPGQPAQDVTLEWSNLKVVVSAAIFGTQMQADLSDTRTNEAGATCTIKYRAVGLSPAIECKKLDADGSPLVKDDGTYETDETLCDPEADPAAGRFLGSGISPLAATECDAVTGFCVLRGDSIPAYQE